MNVGSPGATRRANNNSVKRSFDGCWTCRVRRKKCDEHHPICRACSVLHIGCNYDSEKPDWMDGGAKQTEMAERLKREIKDKAHLRSADRAVRASQSSESPPRSVGNPISDVNISASRAQPALFSSEVQAYHQDWQYGVDCTLTGTAAAGRGFGQPDSILLLFYLEHLLPFMFPFYQPTVVQGGRAWLLQMMITSPVVRQALLCQTSYFFSLLRGCSTTDISWESVMSKSGDAFEVLRRALQVMQIGDISEHIPGAVRTLTSIIQVQRFEIIVSSFDNCQAHLNAAVALFEQIMGCQRATDTNSNSRFSAAMDSLGPSPWFVPGRQTTLPSAEQSALQFSTALLLFDDIIASTVLQEEPKLYRYHREILGGEPPFVNIVCATGCQNSVMLQVGEIAVLDAWKQMCKKAGNLDVMELVRRASVIKTALDDQILNSDTQMSDDADKVRPMDTFIAEFAYRSGPSLRQSVSVSRVWRHAAHLYLSVVVSGWQPASSDVQYHIEQIVELLTLHITPPALLRIMVWPFCVAGCLAQPAQEARFREMAASLRPPAVFGTIRRALEIMENVWRRRSEGNMGEFDLAACFRSQSDLVLLI